MFAIALSLILSSTFIVLLVLILVIFILSIILHLCYYIANDFWTIDFPHLSKEAIVCLNSYLEKLRGEILEPLIENSALTSLI